MKVKILCFISIISIILFSCESKKENNFSAPENINDGIEVSTPAKEGIETRLINNLIDSIEKGSYTNIHSLLILRDNKLVFEKCKYFII